ncbi:ABC transporter permease [Sphingobacterium detergens]|uniref:ABC-type antimicrobial peptide transport system permease subunit n=1 Tax=Sphingobacterium detergens TaxID=1145106 RepID=A0A420BJX6_SPHD1|nr:ABC transporter permease [Sphingobacterium detergens]RKE57023.1 ABC-type antimicrobial peptide transport system permease subunit [Sphingobacterium detergens]
MLKSYLKIAFRNLQKNKGFTAINIVGLAIGMAAAILIMLWVKSEFTYDRFYSKTDQIYAVGIKDVWGGEVVEHFYTPKPMAAALKTDFPEINNVARVNKGTGFLLTRGEIKLSKEQGVFVDSTFLKIFDYKVLAGNPVEALKKPNQIVLTKSFADRLFGQDDPLNQTIKLDSTQISTVSAIIEDIPDNSFMKGTTYLVPWTLMEKIGYSDDYWGNNSIQTYIELEKNVNIDQFQKNIKGFLQKHTENKAENFIEPIADKWLYSNYTEMGKPTSSRIGMVRSFIAIACFILIIACINFMNLSTAQSEKRAKEVGVRKVVGANKGLLIYQFLIESILIACIAGILALLITMLALPYFGLLISRTLTMPYTDIPFWSVFIIFVLFTGILSGSYPAFYLSSFIPVKVLKGKLLHAQRNFNPRKVLVIAQFCIAIILIVTTITIQKQIKYAQNREIGYNKDRLINIIDQGKIGKNKLLIKNALISSGIASHVSRTSSPLTENWSNNSMNWDGKPKDNNTMFTRFGVDDNLVNTAGLKLIAGRDFDLSKFPTDSSAMIINESAAKVFNFDDPIGKTIVDGRDWHIIGVIKDFVQESPFNPVTPLVIQGAFAGTTITNIRLRDHIETQDALVRMEKIFKEYNPEYPFEYAFVDANYAEKFKDFNQLGKLSSLFALLTIFISCLGLYGLTAFMAETRTKEIGVRKVLGASIISITKMLSREFLIMVLLSCLIAFPIAYYISDDMLSSYTYRIRITWDIFLIAGSGAFVLTLLTVSYQSIKAAMLNPVKSLKDE